ncbi:hypothetical protein ACFRAQ_18550 [Nocardia sp. NPDC056611]|uniref:hypothetical protein n=1 Tax=Nocardia sp. NPDC056611 TaxID=3345877 RepID=UPI0036711FD4
MTAVVLSAIAAGALTGLTDTASQAIKDAYSGLKSLLSRKYSGVDVSGVERRPNSDAKKQSLAEDLEDAGVGGDSELAAAAVAVLEAIQRHDPQAVIGVDVKGLTAATLSISDVASAGDGVRVTNSTIQGDAHIAGVRSGFSEPPGPSHTRS